MRRDKLNFNEWIGRIGRLIEELESEPTPPHPLTSLTARLGLQNWLIYRAISAEPTSEAPPRLSILRKSGQRGRRKRKVN